MEKKEYEIMFRFEDDYWWYIALRGLTLSFINKFSHKKDNMRILDAGCGTGGLLARISAFKAYGLDVSEEAMKFCKIRKLRNVIRASVCNIPFSRDSFDLIVSLDVLYYFGVMNDIIVLREFCRVLNRGGILLLNLPAYNFLQSKHDKAVHIKHRYIHKELKEKVKKAGFKIEKISYRNTFFFL